MKPHTIVRGLLEVKRVLIIKLNGFADKRACAFYITRMPGSAPEFGSRM